MPYLDDENRIRLNHGGRARTGGDLNYLITKLLTAFIMDKGRSYTTMNEIVGALESAKLEFYRREVAPYEDTKIAANGDVYDRH